MNLTIKKMYLVKLSEFLVGLKLTGGLSRNRIKFSKIIGDAISELSEDEVNIVKQYCEKDSDDNLIKDDEGNVKIPLENREKFGIEINELYNEELVIDCDVNKTIIDSIARIMLSDDIEISGEFAYIHNDICEQLEEYLEKSKM